MAHECEECGETFETLTRLRRHDCNPAESGLFESVAGTSPGQSPTHGRTESVPELDKQLERVAAGDPSAIHTAVATFESQLAATLNADDGGETHRSVFWPYYERVSDALDEATRSEGWPLLGDVADAYHPATDDTIPLATPAVANAVGRHVIRTRLTEGVDAIPVAALDYLDSVAVHAEDSDDVAREEIHAYGWGIDHPDHAVVDRLHERATDDIFSVNPTLEHAFYADQHAAVDALERLVRDDSIKGTLPRPRQPDIPYRRYLLDCVYGLTNDDHWPTTPRYWNWHETFDYTFELEEPVEQRIRDLVTEMGFETDLPDDWTFRDLGV